MIGAGSLGSSITNIIARTGGKKITIYDGDFLAPENLAPSYASRKYLSFPKVHALRDKLNEELGITINAVAESFSRQWITTNVVIISIDSMEGRRYIWNNHNIEYDLWIDARMGDDQAGVYTHIRGCPTDKYEESLSREGAPLLCGQKATAAISTGLVPGMVGVIVMRWLNQLTIPAQMFAKALMPVMWYSIGETHRSVSEVGLGWQPEIGVV